MRARALFLPSFAIAAAAAIAMTGMTAQAKSPDNPQAYTPDIVGNTSIALTSPSIRLFETSIKTVLMAPNIGDHGDTYLFRRVDDAMTPAMLKTSMGIVDTPAPALTSSLKATTMLQTRTAKIGVTPDSSAQRDLNLNLAANVPDANHPSTLRRGMHGYVDMATSVQKTSFSTSAGYHFLS